MATIREMLNRVNEAKFGLEHEMERIVQLLSEEILDLNRRDQLFQGEDTEGNIIGYYSEATENVWGGRYANPPKIAGEPYNFQDTGDLFQGFALQFRNGLLVIYSTDSKVPLLEEKYGNRLFGLTIENQEKLNYEILKPHLIAFVRRILQV